MQIQVDFRPLLSQEVAGLPKSMSLSISLAHVPLIILQNFFSFSMIY